MTAPKTTSDYFINQQKKAINFTEREIDALRAAIQRNKDNVASAGFNLKNTRTALRKAIKDTSRLELAQERLMLSYERAVGGLNKTKRALGDRIDQLKALKAKAKLTKIWDKNVAELEAAKAGDTAKAAGAKVDRTQEPNAKSTAKAKKVKFVPIPVPVPAIDFLAAKAEAQAPVAVAKVKTPKKPKVTKAEKDAALGITMLKPSGKVTGKKTKVMSDVDKAFAKVQAAHKADVKDKKDKASAAKKAADKSKAKSKAAKKVSKS